MDEIQKMKLAALSRQIKGAGENICKIATLLSDIISGAEAEYIPLSLDELLKANKNGYETWMKNAKAVIAALPDNMG